VSICVFTLFIYIYYLSFYCVKSLLNSCLRALTGVLLLSVLNVIHYRYLQAKCSPTQFIWKQNFELRFLNFLAKGGNTYIIVLPNLIREFKHLHLLFNTHCYGIYIYIVSNALWGFGGRVVYCDNYYVTFKMAAPIV